MLRPAAILLAAFAAAGTGSAILAASAGAQADGPANGVLYTARKGPAEVRLVGVGQGADGAEQVLVDVKVACEGGLAQGRMVGSIEEDGRFEVEGAASQIGAPDVISGEFDDIDGKVRADGAVLEVDVELEEAGGGRTGRCEETQPWRLEPRRSAGSRRIERAVPSDATTLAANGEALFTLGDGEVARLDPQTLATEWRSDVSTGASAIAAAGQAVWVLDPEALELTRIDAQSGDATTMIPLGSPEAAGESTPTRTEIAATDGAAWVAGDQTTELHRVDEVTDAVEVITMPGAITALAAAPGGVDVALTPQGEIAPLVAIPPGVTVVAAPAEALADSGEQAWARNADRVTSLRREDRLVVPFGDVTVGRSPAVGASIVAAAPGAWTTTTRGLALVDTEDRRVGTVPIIGSSASGLVAVDGAVYVVDSGYLFRLAI